MAAFNPAPNPTQDPNYLNYSKPVEYKADQSSEILGKTIADVLGSGTEAADSLVKRHIGDQVEEGVNTLRDQRIAELKAVNAPKTVSNQSLTGEPQQIVPSVLQSVPGQLSQLDARRANGKISDTQYYAELDSKAKALRANFPGYTDYIDKEFEKVSGVKPANAYMKSLATDINVSLQATNTEKQKIMTLAFSMIKEGVPGTDAMLNKWQKDGKDQEFLQWATTQNAVEYGFKLRGLERNEKIQNRTLRIDEAKDEINDRVSAAVNGYMNTWKAASGESWNQLLDKVRSGWQPTDEQAVGLKLEIQKEMAAMEAKLMKDLTASGPGQKGLAESAGGISVGRDIVKAGMQNMHNISDLISEKKMDMATFAANSMDARVKDQQKQLFNRPDIGPVFVQMKLLNGLGDPQLTTKFLNMQIGTQFGSKFDQYLKEQLADVATQPDKGSGFINTLKGFFDSAQSKGAVNPKTNESVLNFYNTMISSKSDEAKKNILLATFSPANYKFIEKFERDSVDENGKPKPGKYSIFSRLLAPEAIKEANRLGMGKMVQDWAENEFAHGMFMEDINSLKNADPRLKVGWNDKDNRIEYQYSKGATLENSLSKSSPDYSRFADPVRTVNRVNGALSTLSNVAKANGAGSEETSAYLIGLLMRSGVDIQNSPNILPAQLLKSIIDTKGKEQLKKAVKDKEAQ